jgi:uncharacterized protein YndB with AHSA1/START domain
MTNGKRDLTYVEYLAASPEKVWKVLTDPEQQPHFFYGTSVSSDYKPGTKFQFRGSDGNLAIDGELVAVEPGRKLVHTWQFSYDPAVAAEGYGTITWELESTGDACRMSTRHELPEGAEVSVEHATSGWPMILSQLKTLVETGRPLVLPMH